MSLKLKDEFSYNLPYFWRALGITLLTIVPQLLMSQSLRYLTTIVFVTLFLLLISKVSKTAFSLFVTYLLILNIFQANVALHWGGQTEDLSPRVEVAMISPQYETSEYFHDFVDYRDYLVFAYSLTVFFILVWFVIYHKHNSKRLKRYALILAFLLFIVLQNQQPFKLLKKFISISERSEVINERNTYLATLDLKKKESVSHLYDKIIIVQGEAANKNFMEVYNYKEPTTPYLTSLRKTGNLTLFNAIAPSNQTRYSVPMIFTKADVHHWRQNFTHSPSILTEMRVYGYKTHWVSNQGKMGEHEDYITNISMEADSTTFLHQVISTHGNSDRVIGDYLVKKTESSEPEVYVFHLMGSHVAYRERYDQKDALYSHPKNIIEEYANTIYATDFIIKDIIEHFDRKGSRLLVIYLSDHGEVVTKERHGHGLLPTFADEYDIPLVVYSNTPNKRIAELHQTNTIQTINAESMNYFIMYIAGLSEDKNISYSQDIFSLEPKNVYPYNTLDYYK